MQLKDINFDKLVQVSVQEKQDYTKIYKGEDRYYKILPSIHASNYIQDGLDYIWVTHTKLSADYVGLITEKTCPALVEYIYDGESCIGYIMHEGETLYDQKIYTDFIEVLVEHSLNLGYAIVDVNMHNVIIFNDAPCLIYINFHPIKIKHDKKLDEHENKLWQGSFSCLDSIYLNKIIKGV